MLALVPTLLRRRVHTAVATEHVPHALPTAPANAAVPMDAGALALLRVQGDRLVAAQRPMSAGAIRRQQQSAEPVAVIPTAIAVAAHVPRSCKLVPHAQTVGSAELVIVAVSAWTGVRT